MTKTTQKKDSSLKVHQGDKLKTPVKIRDKKINDKQQYLLDLIKDKDSKMIFISGPAGTSKTFVSVMAALQLLNNKRVSNLFYLRSIVESSNQKMGYLPGDLNHKLDPYIEPLLEKLEEFLCAGDINLLIENGFVDSIPINFLRGRNWNAKFILMDEAQNLTTRELITLITRMGEYSKLILCGDPYQSDIGNKSGFVELMNLFDDEESRENGIHKFEFTEDDVVRSGLVKFIVNKLKLIIK
jgi:phosphate starvation-inducible protein PhoH and related proteins